nr:Outer membrane efflux protein [uncultured bacterium]
MLLSMNRVSRKLKNSAGVLPAKRNVSFSPDAVRVYRPRNFTFAPAAMFLTVILSVAVFAQNETQRTLNPSPTPAATPTPTPAQIDPAQIDPDAPPVAPEINIPVRPLPSIDRIGVDNANQLPLTLREAIALALKNNNDIDSSRIDVKIAEFSLKAARSVYDPLFTSDNFYENRTTPTASTVSGGANGAIKQTFYSHSSGLGGFSPFAGGSYQANFAASKNVTNNLFATLNPQFPSSLGITYTQPLLRGLRFDQNRLNIEIAKKNVTLSDVEFRRIATEIIAQVEQSYWDLAFALKNLQVQIEAVKQARLQLESNQRLVKQGVLAPIEITAAEVQVTTFEQNVYIAQEAITRAENTLKTLLLPNRTAELWGRPLTPVTPVDLEVPQITLQDSIADALKNRPELTQAQINLEKNRISTRYFRELTKPEVNLYGAYTGAGLAGTNTGVGNSPPPDILIGGIGTSLSNLFGQAFPTYRVGVTISIPLRNGVAKANLGASLAEGNQIEVQQKKTEQGVEAEVRNALQALRSAEARLNAAIAARDAAEKLYASEERQFRAGTSTVFLVQQRQNELVAARGNELLAQTALNKAISEYRRAVGTTLETNNVEINTVK